MSDTEGVKAFDPADHLTEQSEEVQEIARKFSRMRENNQRIQTKLVQQGVTLDIAGARVEFIMAQLIALGLITQEQYWQIQLDWQLNLRHQLSEVREQVAAQVTKMQQRQQAAQRPQLLVPDHVADSGGKGKIIVPGQ